MVLAVGLRRVEADHGLRRGQRETGSVLIMEKLDSASSAEKNEELEILVSPSIEELLVELSPESDSRGGGAREKRKSCRRSRCCRASCF